ncbi:MAG: hypothetical protein JWN72_373, partial [Thermoleophilia bacterium]|nr:hypothetical protein [Thermoleophilia bacterium]
GTVTIFALLMACVSPAVAGAKTPHNRAAAPVETVGADGQTCDDSYAARHEYGRKLAEERPSASNESYLREVYRLMLICKSDQFAVDKIWVTGTKLSGTSLPDTGRLTSDEVSIEAKRRSARKKQARTLSCSASADNPVFHTVGTTRMVQGGGTISCNEQAPLRGWVDLWRRYVSTGTVVIPYNDIYKSSGSSFILGDDTPDTACDGQSSYKSADVLMQRYNGSSWGGNTVLDTLWHLGSNYGCP